jgi:hypothetical protein
MWTTKKNSSSEIDLADIYTAPPTTAQNVQQIKSNLKKNDKPASTNPEL